MILAIDLGSTSFKAGVFGDRLECIGSGAADLVYQYAPGGVVELDPTHVADSVRQAEAIPRFGRDWWPRRWIMSWSLLKPAR